MTPRVAALTGTRSSSSGGNPLSALECYLPRMKAVVPQGPSPRKLTLKQWGELDEDDEGELVDGVLEEEEVPTVIHEAVVIWLVVVLGLWIKPRGGQVLGSGAKLAIAARRGRRPDLSVFPRDALPPGQDTVIRVAPWIVIEVSSPRPRDERRDRIDKPADYARCGARYYWIVNPALRTLEIFELNRRGRYELVLSASGGSVARVPGCPGLRLKLDELWREVDESERR